VGFVHGVMNTDNMSILGLTIDYGPYGWLDNFDPHWTPNTTDAMGRRYRYSQQPAIAQWNLERLADAIRPLFPDVAPLERRLGVYVQRFNAEYRAMLAAKFGFAAFDTDTEALATEGLSLLERIEMDYTLFFRALGDVTEVPTDDATAVALLGDVFYDDAKAAAAAGEIAAWLRRWAAAATAREAMHRVNPRFVLRNYLAQQAIDKATAGDSSMVHELLEVMRTPYDEHPGREAFAAKRPDWARNRAGCSMLSCSS
jgi:serine/tyrosine/threonine adenylyltransferase